MSYIGHAPINHDRTATYSGTAHPSPAQLQVKQHEIPSRDETDTGVSSDSDATPTDEVGQLARYLSTQSQAGNLFEYEKGSSLDPFGDRFDVKLWVRKFATLEDWGTARASGVSFKDMSVFGYGTDSGVSTSSRLFVLVEVTLTKVCRLPEDDRQYPLVPAVVS